MKQTTLMRIFEKYRLGEYDVSTTLWELALEDAEEHYTVILDGSTLFIIDSYEIEAGSDGFYEGSVITIQR